MKFSKNYPDRITVASSGGSLFLATIEAICVFMVSANGVAAFAGTSGVVLAEGQGKRTLFNLWMFLNRWLSVALELLLHHRLHGSAFALSLPMQLIAARAPVLGESANAR